MKPFDPALHRMYDSRAKDAIIKYLYATEGVVALEGRDAFGVDLVDLGGPAGWHEVETKRRWGNHKFQFLTVHIMARKLRLFETMPETDGTFWVTNNDYTRALRIPAWCVLASPVVIEANMYMSREEVCDVPIGYAQEVML